MVFFPFEILIRIFSSLQFDSKHVVSRVNRLWKEAGDVAIGKQKRLTVYKDDAFDPADVTGMSAQRLMIVYRMNQLSVFSGITELDMKLDIDPMPSYMPRVQVAFCLPEISYDEFEAELRAQRLAPNPTKLVTGIRFPSFKELVEFECSGLVLSEVMRGFLSLPQLQKLTLAAVKWDEWDDQVIIIAQNTWQRQMTSITIHSLNSCMDHLKLMFNLMHITVTMKDSSTISNRFFDDMDRLVTVNLTAEIPTKFSDTGVEILLDNNPNLKDVTLSGFPLTDTSLVYFTEYVQSHALEKLTLKSSATSGFTQAAINQLAAAGSQNKLKHLSISSGDLATDFLMNIQQ